MSEPDWRQFEIAIADFLKALGPTAKVTHDAKIPDEHTGHPRQRDVWIESSLLGLFPVKLLVSCKHYGRALDQQDVDHFNGEFISSGAHKGVLYSLGGFNDFAIEKAKKLGFCCCRFYQDSPADLPEALNFQTYCITSRVRLTAVSLLADDFDSITWGDVFAGKVGREDGTILDALADEFERQEERALNAIIQTRGFPKPWTVRVTFSTADEPSHVTIEMGESWRTWRGNIEAHLLNGSYNVTTEQFVGSQSGPTIDMQGPDPGPGWTLLDSEPELNRDGSFVLCIPRADPKRGLGEAFSKLPVRKSP